MLRSGRRMAAGDRGETLLELIVALAILGISIVAIGAGLAVSSRASGAHRQNSTATYWLRNAAEQLQSHYDGSCPPNYATWLPSKPDSSFATPAVSVVYWDAATSTFDSSSCPASDPGVQSVTITLQTSDLSTTDTLTVVLRKQT